MGIRNFANLATEKEPLKLTTAEYTVEDSGSVRDEPIVHLICRRPNGKRRHIEVEGFYPSFYITGEEFLENKTELINEGRIRWMEVPESMVNKEDDRELFFQDSVRMMDDGNEVQTLHDEKLVKIVCGIPKHTSNRKNGGLSDYFDQTWESDVFFTQRFLIDTGVKTGFRAPVGEDRVHFSELEPLSPEETPNVESRTIYLDIEVYSDGEFPDPTEAEQPVTSISAYDSYDDEYKAWILHTEEWANTVPGGYGGSEEDFEKMEDHFEEQYDERWPGTEVRVFADESYLLDDFHEYVIDRRPDIMTGWNAHKNDIGNGFDFPYLINRSKAVNAWNVNDWSPLHNGNVFVTRAGSAVVEGIELFDMLRAYEKTQIHELDQKSLDYVANKELGMGKEDIDDLNDAWAWEPTKFLMYNIRDTEAVVEIEESQSVISMYDHLRDVTGQLYSECHHNISMIDMLFLRDAFEKNIALPTSEKPNVRHYHGAKVFTPSPGRSENVFYPDLASLYPNLFWATNMSPETVIGNYEDLQASDYAEEDCFVVYWDPRDEEMKKDDDTPDYVADQHDEALYVIKPDIKKGFVRDSIGSLIDMKYLYKGTDKYGAVKRVTNSCFTPDTEVMTPDGVRNIRDLDVGDKVYSLNPDTHQMEVKQVTELIEKPDYDDELVTIQNNTIDLKVTPDHRLYTKRQRHSDEFEAVDAGGLNSWTSYEMATDWSVRESGGVGRIDLAEYVNSDFEVTETDGVEYIRNAETINGRPGWVKRYYSEEEMAKLVGWFATEGHSVVSSSSRVAISQKTPEHFEEVEECLSSTGRYVSKDANGFNVHNRLLAEATRNMCGESSSEKKLPEWVFETKASTRKELRSVLMKGDGDSDANRFSTQSKKLRDQFLQLCWELGDPAQYNRDSDVWCVYFGEKSQSFRMNRSGNREGDGNTEQAENGVYCVQVEDNHMLVAGRNGKFVNIFNCYGVMGDSDTYGKGFRLFDVRIAEAITLAGRKVLEFTAKQIRNWLQNNGFPEAEIVGGDTDSAMCSVPGYDIDPEDIWADFVRHQNGEPVQTPIFKSAKYANDSYDEFMAETFNIEKSEGYEHKMEVEVECVADALFFKSDYDADNPEEVGKKKRYSQTVVVDEDDGIIENPEAEHTGWDLVRSDASGVTKWAQGQVLTLILKSDTPKDDTLDFLEESVNYLKNGDLDGLSEMAGREFTMEDVGIPKSISSAPPEEYGVDDETGENTRTPHPHIRGAKYATQNIPDESIEQGAKPYLYHVERMGGDYPQTYTADTLEDGNIVDAIAVENPSNIPNEARMDWDVMVEKLLKNPINEIIMTMGWTWEDVTNEGRQAGLDAWA